MNLEDKVYKVEGYNVLEKYLFEYLEDYNYYIDKKDNEIKRRYMFFLHGLFDSKKNKLILESTNDDDCKILFMNLLYPAYEMFNDNWILSEKEAVEIVYKNILKDLDDYVLNNDELLNIKYFCEKYSDYVDVGNIKKKL